MCMTSHHQDIELFTKESDKPEIIEENEEDVEFSKF